MASHTYVFTAKFSVGIKIGLRILYYAIKTLCLRCIINVIYEIR